VRKPALTFKKETKMILKLKNENKDTKWFRSLLIIKTVTAPIWFLIYLATLSNLNFKSFDYLFVIILLFPGAIVYWIQLKIVAAMNPDLNQDTNKIAESMFDLGGTGVLNLILPRLVIVDIFLVPIYFVLANMQVLYRIWFKKKTGDDFLVSNPMFILPEVLMESRESRMNI
jgi:hypothetical protein